MYSVVLISMLFFSVIRAESQICTSVTTTTCDGENPSFASSSPESRHGNAVKRGKAGAKGDKGEKGPAGPAGTDLSEVVAEVLAATARNSRQIGKNSALLSELRGEVSNFESEALEGKENRTIKKLFSLVVEQNEKVLRLTKYVDDLSSQLKVIIIA